MIKISNNSLTLLKRCLKNQNKTDLIPVIENPGSTEFTAEFYNQLREIVSDEFCDYGLEKNYEPNEYGLNLENLIDEIGRLFLHK